jgi:hypothetical protein
LNKYKVAQHHLRKRTFRSILFVFEHMRRNAADAAADETLIDDERPVLLRERLGEAYPRV